MNYECRRASCEIGHANARFTSHIRKDLRNHGPGLLTHRGQTRYSPPCSSSSSTSSSIRLCRQVWVEGKLQAGLRASSPKELPKDTQVDIWRSMDLHTLISMLSSA